MVQQKQQYMNMFHTSKVRCTSPTLRSILQVFEKASIQDVPKEMVRVEKLKNFTQHAFRRTMVSEFYLPGANKI